MKPVILALVGALVLSLFYSAWRLRGRFEIVGEFVMFLRERKLWWITPLVLVFVLAGLFVAVTAGSPLAAFLYALH
jgi:chromate transport protein ChrA